MKTASFSYDIKNTKHTIYGKVTLNDLGKISVSIPNAKHFSSASRWEAKLLAHKIVELDFKHESVFNFVEVKSDSGLIASLTEQTQEFKALYIEKTKEYAKNYFAFATKQLEKTMEEWCKQFDVEYEYVEYPYAPGKKSFSIKKHNLDYHKMKNHINKLRGVIQLGVEKYEEMEVKNAKKHYTQSIEKLAYRLNKKGIVDGSEFDVKTVSIGVNLNITIKHGDQVTRAFTVIAQGPIQRPHYRYLIK